jgi:hypothetical protein
VPGVIEALIKALPQPFLVILTAAVFIAAVVFLPRLRRDKQGKLYIYSHTYEARKHDKKLDTLINEVKVAKEATLDNSKDILRLTFYNEKLSNVERMVAGRRYLSASGNGETRKAIDKLAAQFPLEWNAVCEVSVLTEKEKADKK